ncbi:hypothetical protein CANARDRAFT_7960 [[Candida] arabinofermentans NRRL YB-2248]|uniref:Uncharacterized protein n=1 Tax=[Candida] arabinofermentans NRRL YB-2248 TaxID=983967 RepID=A0A1E4T0M3_9ASCO|nr:hypothetical protein CANARDRAFT_7960 [[Candida] arabinofermentans NRRL YB-2248]
MNSNHNQSMIMNHQNQINSNNKRKYSSNNQSSISSSTSLNELLNSNSLNVSNLNFHLLNYNNSPPTNDYVIESSRYAKVSGNRSSHHHDNINKDKNIKVSSSIVESENNLLDSSEWILFSPEHQDHEDATTSDPYYDDVLSSTVDRTDDINDSYIDVEDELSLDDDKEAEGEEEEEEEDDDDDSLIEDLQEHISKNIPFKKEDLNNRIDSWRRQQVNILLSELNSERELDDDTLDLIKSWGIDDSFKDEASHANNLLGRLNNSNNNNSTNSIIHNSYQGKHYGDKLLIHYTNEDLRTLKKILMDLSSALHRSSNSKISRPKKKIHQVDSIKHKKHNTVSTRHERFMNNRRLQKYIPIFLKNLIIQSELLPDFQKKEDEEVDDENDEDGDEDDGALTDTDPPKSKGRSESVLTDLDTQSNSTQGNDFDVLEVRDPNINRVSRLTKDKSHVGGKATASNENFWEGDLNSVNSSVLTYSTGSIVGF